MSAPVDPQVQWTAFLQRWPLSALAQLTLAQYSTAGDADCLTHWLEHRTDALGSIRGGSAFKFGLFARRANTAKTPNRDRSYSANYAWYGRLGTTPEQAFAQLHSQLLTIAHAAQQGDLETIEATELGHVVKWKLAFLYQPRHAPCVLPLYARRDLLGALATDEPLTTPEIYRQLLAARTEQSLWAYAEQCWQRSRQRQRQATMGERALDWFSEQPERFFPLRTPAP